MSNAEDNLRWAHAGAQQGHIEHLQDQVSRYKRAMQSILEMADDDAKSDAPAMGGYTTLIIAAIARHALEGARDG